MKKAFVLVLCAVLTFLMGARQEEEAEEASTLKKPVKPLYFEDEFKIRDLVDKIDRAVKKNETENALRLYQKLVDDYTQKLVSSRSSVVPVWKYVLEKISGLSDDARKQYNNLFNAAAADSYKRAVASNDLSQIEQVAFRYYHTETGVQAAEGSANLYAERGDVTNVLKWVRILLDTKKTSASAAHLARLAHVASLTSDPHTLDFAKKEVVERKLTSEKIVVNGASVEFHSYLKSLEEQLSTIKSAPADASPLSISLSPKSLSWRQEIPGGKALFSDEPRRRGRRVYYSSDEVYIVDEHGNYHRASANSELARYPFTAVTQGDVLAVNLGKSLYLHDLSRDGDPVWTLGGQLNLEVFLKSLRFSRPYPHYFTAVHGGRVVATLEGERKAGVTTPRNKLVVVDPARRATLWRSDWIKDLEDLSFNGMPLVAGTRIFIGATLHEKPDEVYILALDAETGMILWKRFLAEGGTPSDKNAFDIAITPTLGLDRDTLFCATNRGIVAALNVENGEIRWATKYGAAPGEIKWAPNALIVHRGRVITAPVDSNYLHVFDRHTGEAIKKISRGESRHLLGIRDDLLFAAGPECFALDLKTLTLRWTWEAPYGEYVGKGLLAADAMLVPTSRKLFRLNLDSGDISGMTDWEKPELAGMIVITPNQLISVSEQFVSSFK